MIATTKTSLACLGAALLFVPLLTAPAPANNVFDTILNRTTAARDRARQARDSANEVRAKVREGAEHLTDEVKTMMKEMVDDLKSRISLSLDGRDEFASKSCESFRTRLIDVMTGVQRIANRVQELVTCPDADRKPIVDFDAEIAWLEQIPCRVLYPMAEIELPPCLADKLHEGAEALDRLTDIFEEAMKAQEEARSQQEELEGEPETDEDALRLFRRVRMARSRVMVAQYEFIERQLDRLDYLALVVGLIGQGLNAAGELELFGDVGLHGYVHVNGRLNVVKQYGTTFEAIGDAVSGFSKKARGKLDRATSTVTQDEIARNQEKIIANQEALLEALGVEVPDSE